MFVGSLDSAAASISKSCRTRRAFREYHRRLGAAATASRQDRCSPHLLSAVPPGSGSRRNQSRAAGTSGHGSGMRSRKRHRREYPRGALRRPDHHGHPHGKVPLDVAVEKPETGVVLLPLNDRVAAGMDADCVLLAGRVQVQRAVVVVTGIVRALV
jgi:hypothetical protein